VCVAAPCDFWKCAVVQSLGRVCFVNL
jgi:hypothetical protein